MAQTSDKPVCKICDKEYYKLYNLKRHIVTIHGFNYQDYLESFDENNNDNYINTNDNYINTNDNCINTNYNYINTNELCKNIANQNKHLCSKCNKVFARKWNLTKHTEKCKGVIDRYSCEYCKKQFTHGNSRYKHILNFKT